MMPIYMTLFMLAIVGTSFVLNGKPHASQQEGHRISAQAVADQMLAFHYAALLRIRERDVALGSPFLGDMSVAQVTPFLPPRFNSGGATPQAITRVSWETVGVTRHVVTYVTRDGATQILNAVLDTQAIAHALAAKFPGVTAVGIGSSAAGLYRLRNEAGVAVPIAAVTGDLPQNTPMIYDQIPAQLF